MLSFLLPGFDQFYEGQTAAGFAYAGYGLSGLVLAAEMQNKTTTPGQADISSRNNVKRQFLLGGQMYELAGAMSAYQSYRSLNHLYRDQGSSAYDFIKRDETSLDLLSAPFDFRFLKKTTTWLPLSFILVTVAAAPQSQAASHYINGSDVGYLSAFSYQAGVAEESIFRGALLPSLHQWWGNGSWANLAQATAFGAVHISSENPFPLPQMLLGWYLGWVTQQNEYSLRESIFIHAWWDVIAFTATYLDQTAADRATNVYLPLVDARF